MKARQISELVLLILGLIALCHIALANGVRTVLVKPNSIEPIYLSMGKSTVLRFRDHPRKIVIGNQNYFGVEFIENDVALQPLGQIKTNMFVYTENKTYGFYLIVGQGRSDDLAKIEWQPLEMKESVPRKPMTPMTALKAINGISLKLSCGLKLSPIAIQYSPDHRMYILDFFLENIFSKEINLNSVSLMITKDKLSISKQILVKEIEKLKPKEKSKIRLFFALESKSDLKVILSNANEKAEFILSQKYFK